VQENASLGRIARLPFVLTWASERGFAQGQVDDYAALLETTFEAWLSGRGNDALAQSCRRLFASLSRSAQRRFLRMAGTRLEIVANGSRGEEFENNVFAQHLQAYFRHMQLSDDADPARRRIGVLPLAGPGEREIWVDASGIYVTPGMTATGAYDNEDMNDAIGRLRHSLGLVRSASEAAADLIESVIQVVILRQDGADPTGFGSSSWPGRAGLMALTNFQRHDLNDGWRADALVHESVHSLLYMIECHESFYTSETAGLGYHAVSPWSGKALHLHSFVHACFVWFGLWCFWDGAAASRCFADSTVDFFRSRARRGFNKDLLSRLGAGRHEVVLPVREAIGRIETIVGES
jgi:HEXXH motif-containing protein